MTEQQRDLADLSQTLIEGDAEREAAAAAANEVQVRADEELPPVLFEPGEAEVEDVSFYQKAAIRRVVDAA